MHQAKSQFITGKPVRVPKVLREEVEAAIQAHLTAVEKLTAVLDKADGDTDGEPSLGALNANSLCQLRWGWTGTDDREEQCEDEGAQCD